MRLVDLFAGCGGMTAGFVEAGFDPILSVEWDLAAAATYAANFGEGHTRHLDVADVSNAMLRKLGSVDVVIGGPPCQGFSNLGRKDPADPRNSLWREFMRVIVEVKPKVFVIENVDRFARSPEHFDLTNSVRRGKLRGYELSTHVLNAADFGVPQRRQRTIVIGSRVGTPSHPSPTHARDSAGDLLPWRSVRDAFEGIPLWPDTTSLPSSKERFFGVEVPGVFKAKDLHIGRNPTELSLKRYDAVPPGGSRFDVPEDLLPDCWRNKPTGTTDVMGRMRWEAPSLTVRTEFFKPEKGQYLHPQWAAGGDRVNRPITHWEAARLQTFPDSFLWCGTKMQIAKQIGNAVPPRLAYAIATQVKRLLR